MAFAHYSEHFTFKQSFISYCSMHGNISHISYHNIAFLYIFCVRFKRNAIHCLGSPCTLKMTWSLHTDILLLIMMEVAVFGDRASCLGTQFLNWSVGSRWSALKQIPECLQ